MDRLLTTELSVEIAEGVTVLLLWSGVEKLFEVERTGLFDDFCLLLAILKES